MTADPTNNADSADGASPDNELAATDPVEGIGRAPIYTSLGLSLGLVAVVLAGARIIGGGAPTVTLSDLPAEHADSAECQQLIDSLPDEVADLPRAEIAEPAPAGVAAWAAGSSGAGGNYRDQVSLRCGVDTPFQYSEYSHTQVVAADGASSSDNASDSSSDGNTATEWLEVQDQTPGSTLTTWYSTNRFPTVAVTVDRAGNGTAGNDGAGDDGADDGAGGNAKAPDSAAATTREAHKAIAQLTGATEALELRKHQPHPAPLSELASGTPEDLAACQSLISAAQDGFTPAEGYELYDGTAKDTIAWTHPGYEPIVLRCGIADPDVPLGERLQQINEVPWFEDTVLADGTTASTWYPLGREVAVAVSTPQAAAQESLSRITELLKQHTAAAPNAG
ncbi:DUF3515 domain-containing protein [Corynebacterium pseudodiphtheriticum]|uniref:DUF3515 domain-containing protein n=1 Tax=Corynebacterium pseudodiphtheriticum TaxID=37637 RepID=UPI0020BFB957|nr:DUF3515 domain-containing protein [Corynebacterium pseudodiphtheriticum]MDK8479101.1 DUF3515 domain-containing protein [Corynebacterium pseudodiphtheriticum]MDK8486552.1 DUF3515 domain-containing protein [Corynebacterium pseudodiphtheriticum]MDK8493935.1 DUF3515 domain-containing protein [Corynebacterium pseudodiphtheriticum]MDK8551768.1 DUF3515 domain-containing protein [Corynebacterium pseudodiphtheriticum]UQV59037.1 DUF3515 domain-containing protein [Corynebacterium pseudodiphtheriticum]